jgi:hypothetical protein
MVGDTLLCYGSQIALSSFMPEHVNRKRRRKRKALSPVEKKDES